MKHLRLQATCSKNRHELIHELTDVISNCGWLVDSKLYSNKSAFFFCEIDAPRQFIDLFCGLNIALLEKSKIDVQTISEEKIVKLSINISFFHNEPDLIIETPEVPG